MAQTEPIFLLAAVDDDIFRHNTALQHALFGVIATASEQAWRLNLEVANLLLVSVNDAKAVFSCDLLILFLQLLWRTPHEFIT